MPSRVQVCVLLVRSFSFKVSWDTVLYGCRGHRRRGHTRIVSVDASSGSENLQNGFFATRVITNVCAVPSPCRDGPHTPLTPAVVENGEHVLLSLNVRPRAGLLADRRTRGAVTVRPAEPPGQSWPRLSAFRLEQLYGPWGGTAFEWSVGHCRHPLQELSWGRLLFGTTGGTFLGRSAGLGAGAGGDRTQRTQEGPCFCVRRACPLARSSAVQPRPRQGTLQGAVTGLAGPRGSSLTCLSGPPRPERRWPGGTR